MYWYLSFLRPPPVAIHLGENITITPQIANDLRTEIKSYPPTPIHYTWDCLAGPNAGRTDPPAQLTIYDPPASTYRALVIPLPACARAGDAWRLGMFVPPASGPNGVLDGAEGVTGGTNATDVPLGVWSGEGVRVLPPRRAGMDSEAGRDQTQDRGKDKKSKGKGKDRGTARADEGGKQARITRAWALDDDTEAGGPRDGTSERDALEIVEQTSFDLDKKIWDSGLALAGWLTRCLARRGGATGEDKSSLPDQAVIEALFRPGGAHVVEIGAGTGIVAIALAIALARRRPRRRGSSGEDRGQHSIITTDLDSAIPLIEDNIARNERLWRAGDYRAGKDEAAEGGVEADAGDGAEAAETGGNDDGLVAVRPLVLDWDKEVSYEVWRDASGVDATSDSRGIDLVIAADVTYNTASFPALVSTLLALLTPRDTTATAPPPTPLLLLAYKQRDPGERELWSMVEGRIELERVDTVRGHERAGEEEGSGEGEEERRDEGAVEIWLGRLKHA